MTGIPIPHRMAHLPLDRRGLPVPVIVMHDLAGNPIFAANDEMERQRVIREDRCQICGDRLNRGRWFVGGTLSVAAKHGLNLDSGMHDECCHYALKVCPYLAAPRYGALVGEKAIAKSGARDAVMIMPTGTEGNTRPELFLAVMAVGQELRQGGRLIGGMVYGVRPKPGSIRKLEIWRHGTRLMPTPMLGIEIRLAVEAAGDQLREDIASLLP
jgi:hypothetical protein